MINFKLKKVFKVNEKNDKKRKVKNNVKLKNINKNYIIFKITY